MKIAVKRDQDLAMGPLSPVAFTIPNFLEISPKIFQKQSGKTIGSGSVKALILALGEIKP